MSTGKLSAAEIEAIRALVNEPRNGPRLLDVTRALLDHLDALKAEAAPVDREALGLESRRKWNDLAYLDLGTSSGLQEAHRATASHLYQLGHAAGARSRDGEVAARAEKHCDDMEFASAKSIEQDREIARLAAELEQTRDIFADTHQRLETVEVERDFYQTERERLTAERDEARALLSGAHREADANLATARIEGEAAGREVERQECIEIADMCADEEDGRIDRYVIATGIAAKIRARGLK